MHSDIDFMDGHVWLKCVSMSPEVFKACIDSMSPSSSIVILPLRCVRTGFSEGPQHFTANVHSSTISEHNDC